MNEKTQGAIAAVLVSALTLFLWELAYSFVTGDWAIVVVRFAMEWPITFRVLAISAGIGLLVIMAVLMFVIHRACFPDQDQDL